MYNISFSLPQKASENVHLGWGLLHCVGLWAKTGKVRGQILTGDAPNLWINLEAIDIFTILILPI